jgi:hypothetical protein
MSRNEEGQRRLTPDEVSRVGEYTLRRDLRGDSYRRSIDGIDKKLVRGVFIVKPDHEIGGIEGSGGYDPVSVPLTKNQRRRLNHERSILLDKMKTPIHE